ncbi:DUF6383 domain-containing protein [Parabacteroides sp.]
MNKKFSTLLCASLLLGSAFAVSAADLTSAPRGANAGQVPYLTSATPVGVYQLRAKINGTEHVLVVEGDKYKMVAVDAPGLDVKTTLWCVQITESENKGQEPIYDFINKSTGAILAFDEAGVSTVGQSFGGWAFSPTWTKNGGKLKAGMPMYTYTEADKVLLMQVNVATGAVSTKAVNADVAVRERPATDVTGTENHTTDGTLKLTLFNAGTYVLSADEINEYLKDNKNKLTFAPDANADVNPFSANEIKALATTGNASADHNFVYIVKKDDKEKTYLKVDTAANGVGIEFLKFGWSNTEAKGYEDAVTTGMLAKQHEFLFTYRPSVDSLFIQVKEARMRDNTKPAGEKGYWKDAPVYNYANNYGAAGTAASYTYHDIWCENADKNADQLFVKLQNYTVAERIATIGYKAINTKIGFGLNGCVASSDKTSLDEGLYIIKNAKGQVLAAPIHLNDDKANNEAQWVTLDEQDPIHMPAYQWVVTKVYTADKAKATSPVNFVNREYPDRLVANSVQLRLNEDGEIVGSALFNGTNKDLAKATFTRITDTKILGDKKLGYRYIPTDSLMVNKYVFNYLNPFTDNYWMANGADKDSVNYVKETASRYMLEEGSTSGYGYGYGKADNSAEGKVLARLGIARLERTNYVIHSVDGAKSLVEAYNEKYSMGVNNYQTDPYVVDTFFFKENNHYNGKHFYAIVESTPIKEGTAWKRAIIQNAASNVEFEELTHKVGTADDGKSAVLKVQILNETRTSAFTVEADKTPLYRRFNNELLGEKKNDAADKIIFKEKIRGEYLMDEWNKNLQDRDVDYAGIWNKDKADGKLVFNIDTAWVNRGLGYIKPQYLISVARQDQDLNVVTHPCTEGTPHIKPDGTPTDDPYECVHATHKKLGFAYGKYLVSFGDSAMRQDMDAPYMDIKGGYTRVGFVKAIKVGDSLVVLTNGFEKVEPAKIDTAKIFANYKATGCERFIVNLKDDNHKNVTWSFRYVNPLKAAQAYVDGEEGENNEFLFESNIYNEDQTQPTNTTVAGVSIDGKATKGYATAKAASIAPEYAAWLKMQNGCLVLTRGDSKFDAAKTGSDGALIFNAVRPTEEDDMVTSNDEVSIEGVSVVSGNGTVTIQGAAGKSVVITNILGKVVAETVLASDNATIAVSAGIVAVAVEGEEAVKTVVK